jgi:hypothetical protein
MLSCWQVVQVVFVTIANYIIFSNKEKCKSSLCVRKILEIAEEDALDYTHQKKELI